MKKMKKFLFLLVMLFFWGCQTNHFDQAKTDQNAQTKIILSNIGTTDIDNLWLSFDDMKIDIGDIKPGEYRVIYVKPIGKKRIDYGFDGDEAIRNRMGGELYFIGNHIPGRAGIFTVGFNGGLIHESTSQQF